MGSTNSAKEILATKIVSLWLPLALAKAWSKEENQEAKPRLPMSQPVQGLGGKKSNAPDPSKTMVDSKSG